MKTPMMELRDKLIVSANDGNKGPFPDEYHKGYSDALKSIANDIEVQMIEKEKTQIKTAFNAGYYECENYSQDRTTNAEKYYNNTFEK